MDSLVVLESIFEKSGHKSLDEVKKKIAKLMAMVKKWNARTNLVSRADESELMTRHILESLAVLDAVDFPPKSKILDVGSGGGFPALPLAFVCSESRFFLVESKRMKALFLRDVVSQLEMKNVEVYNNRIEDQKIRSEWAEYFDFGLSRAVSEFGIVYGWIKELLKPSGIYIAWKGGDVENEINDLYANHSNVFVKRIKMNSRFVSTEKERCFLTVFKN